MLHEPETASPRPVVTRLVFNSDPMEVRNVLIAARKAWRADGLNDDHCGMAEQVIAEALNNVVEHAQAERPGGKIVLETRRNADALECRIMDDGAPMPDDQLPKGELADVSATPLDDLPEGGFGWFLIRTLTCGLNYRRVGDWNHLSFTILA